MTASTSTTAGPADEKQRLLVIDDDQKLCRLIGDYLEPLGYAVTAVHTGPEGVDAAASDDWQAIILDVMLPGQDGFEVLKQIRKESDTPVLMLTARGDEADRIVGLELGADDYLPKTFSTRELLARLLDGPSAAGTPTTPSRSPTSLSANCAFAPTTARPPWAARC